MEGEQKKERPQNKNLKPLGSGLRTPEEELEIRRKGKKASDKSRKRNADIRAAVKAVANLNAKGKKQSFNVENMKNIEQVNADGVPLIAQMVYAQFVQAINGDKEARDWISRMLGVSFNDSPSTDGAGSQAADGEDTVDSQGGVRIHLIRGERPKEELTIEDEATREKAKQAMLEALKAIGEAEAAETGAGGE